MSTLQEDRATERKTRMAEGIRSLLVHVEGSAEASPRLHVAVDLARKLDATLLGAGIEMFQPISDPYGALGGAWLNSVQQIVDEDLQRAEATFRAHSHGLRTEWFGVESFPARALARLSRSADLIIAGGVPLKMRDSHPTADTAELVMLSGRPILVAPPAGGKFRGDAVVVAWKDTRESRRAVADSLPFLKAAEEVVVLEVCEADSLEDASDNTTDVVHNLRRHGVTARGKTVAAGSNLVATAIENEARTIGADLIVAGAYGHSRLGEWASGGVTHDLLHRPERFVLLSH